jgi:hypothetical protein
VVNPSWIRETSREFQSNRALLSDPALLRAPPLFAAGLKSGGFQENRTSLLTYGIAVVCMLKVRLAERSH